MGSAHSTFNDFQKSTGPLIFTSADTVINEAQKKNYLLRRFLKGSAAADIVKGGSKIKDQIMFDEGSTFQFYLPNDTFTWVNPQILDEWEINWRFGVDHMSWTDQEVELNNGAGMTGAARAQQFKDLKRTKEQRMWTSMLNGMENQLFVAPVSNNMEATAGKEPYSIPAFVNEFLYGQWGEGAAGTNAESGSTIVGTSGNTDLSGVFTTVEGLNPASEPRWVPQQWQYGATSATTPTFTDLIAGFDTMWTLVRFDPPPTRQEYFENGELFGQFIACSRDGQNRYRSLLRNSQDLFVTASRQDPAFVKPQYAGVDLEYVAALDNAAIYPSSTHTTPQTEAASTENGPRYYWLNAKYLKMVFHSTRYMMTHDPMRHPNQPFTTIQPVDTWYNMVCRSRRRLGILYPSAAAF